MKMAEAGSSTFMIEIITPERKFFQRDVQCVVVPAPDGELGILKGHAPMVAAISTGLIKIKQEDGKWIEAFTSEGFLEVRQDETIILSQEVEWPDEIDLKRAQAEKQRAEEKLRQAESMRQYRESRITLTRQLVKLKVKDHYKSLE